MTPVQLGEAPIRLLDVSETSGGLIVAAIDDDGVFYDRRLSWRKNLLTGRIARQEPGFRSRTRGPWCFPDQLPHGLVLNDAGDLVLLVDDGRQHDHHRAGPRRASSGRDRPHGSGPRRAPA